jgi:hypothetical protein
LERPSPDLAHLSWIQGCGNEWNFLLCRVGGGDGRKSLAFWFPCFLISGFLKTHPTQRLADAFGRALSPARETVRPPEPVLAVPPAAFQSSVIIIRRSSAGQGPNLCRTGQPLKLIAFNYLTGGGWQNEIGIYTVIGYITNMFNYSGECS